MAEWTRRLFGEPVEAAERIKNQIKEELGFTVNIGISSNKLLAKMASDFQKPDRVHTLFPEEIPQKPYQIYQTVCALFDEKWDGTPIRLIGVATTKASKEEQGRQMNLFDDTDYGKLEKLDKAMDAIRERYGTDAVILASSMEEIQGKTIQERQERTNDKSSNF